MRPTPTACRRSLPRTRRASGPRAACPTTDQVGAPIAPLTAASASNATPTLPPAAGGMIIEIGGGPILRVECGRGVVGRPRRIVGLEGDGAGARFRGHARDQAGGRVEADAGRQRALASRATRSRRRCRCTRSTGSRAAGARLHSAERADDLQARSRCRRRTARSSRSVSIASMSAPRSSPSRPASLYALPA